jgi:hypothetical protein
MMFVRVLARIIFPGVPYLESGIEELWARLTTLVARFTEPERDYYSADYPDDWTF